MFLISFTNPFKGNVKPPRFKKHILLSSCMVLSSNLSEFQPYSTRTATNKCLRTPKPDLYIMKHSFQYSGPFLRNKLYSIYYTYFLQTLFETICHDLVFFLLGACVIIMFLHII